MLLLREIKFVFVDDLSLHLFPFIPAICADVHVSILLDGFAKRDESEYFTAFRTYEFLQI